MYGLGEVHTTELTHRVHGRIIMISSHSQGRLDSVAYASRDILDALSTNQISDIYVAIASAIVHNVVNIHNTSIKIAYRYVNIGTRVAVVIQ